MTAWAVLELELFWIVSLFSQDLDNTCQIRENTPITCHHKFQLDESIYGNQGWIALPFVVSQMSLSYGCVLILPFCTSSLCFSPHDPILTGHQALAPSSPMLLFSKSTAVRVEFRFRASARAWQEPHDLRNAMKPKAKTIPQSCEKSPHNSSRQTQISTVKWNSQSPWLIIDTMPRQSVVYFA